MDEQAYQYWQVLHQRVALGGTLSAAEQAAYEAGCQELDAEERLDGNLERLRELRAQIAAAETEQQRLREREAELDARIVCTGIPPGQADAPTPWHWKLSRMAPAKLAAQFKGYTSRLLRQEFRHLRSQLPSLWSRSYYIGSVGHVSEATVRRYIENQNGRS